MVNEAKPNGKGQKQRLRTWERRIRVCKKKHRTYLKDWGREGFYFADLEILCRRWYLPSRFQIPRVHCSDLSVQDFISRYEQPALPVIIRGIPHQEGWRALNWSFENIRSRFKDRRFKCGESNDGYSLKIKLKYFIDYLRNNTDDSPLYVFDSHFDDDADAKQLLHDFKVPSYFPDDLFSLVGEKKRPPYRWFLVGPKRSGSCVHIDPLGTSAWNTVLAGRKLWVLFPPNTPKHIAKAKDFESKGQDDEAIGYFSNFVPRMLEAMPDLQVTSFVQFPGETVFVPGGWWHAVLNIDDTLAVTQNFCSRTNFETVWLKTRTGRKTMAVTWLERIEEVDRMKRAKKEKRRRKREVCMMRVLS